MNWLKKIYTTVITVHKRVLCTLGVKLSLLTILNLTGAGRFSTFQKKYLLPGVKLQGGDADLFNLIFSDTKQQVPMRLGGQRYLGKDGIKRLNTSISWTDGQWQWTKKQKHFWLKHCFLSPAEPWQRGICRHRRWSQLGTSQTHWSSGCRSCSSCEGTKNTGTKT